ncbi:MAG: phage portal protein, family [Anaerolineales bacterium]|nr:phage portal protein, HK97 family [Anaerolineales bacterium]MBM2842533.1 phage portal protein, family [Anaerolineales bacterium]
MSFVAGLERRALKITAGSLQNPPTWLREWMGGSGGPTASGKRVDEETALQYTAVLACVRIHAETFASLPWDVFRRLVRGRERATDHALWPLLHDAPNPEITSFTFRETAVTHEGTWGNSYAEIERNNAGRPIALWPIPPKRVKVKRNKQTKALEYHVTLPDGDGQVLARSQVFHVPWTSTNGVTGLSPIGLMREAIGLGLAAEEFGARFFGDGARLGAVFEHPGKLSDTAHKRLVSQIEDRHRGLSRAHRIALLEEGMKVHEVGIPPEDAQFLQTRSMQRGEIASVYRVPPHMIGDTEKSTSWGSGIEEQTLGFVVYSTVPRLVRWEQATQQQLFFPSERGEFYSKFLVEGLLRGDPLKRAQAREVQRRNGIINADEWREGEDMNPLPDGLGQVYTMPLNVGSLAKIAEQPADGKNSTRELRSATARRRIAESYRKVFAQAAERIVKREVADVRRAIARMLTRDAQSFSDWLEEYYRTQPEFAAEQVGPVYAAYAEAVNADAADEIGVEPGMTSEMETFVGALVAAFAARYGSGSLGQLRDVLAKAQEAGVDVAGAIDERLTEWQEKRPEKVASRETVQAGNAVAKKTWEEAGIEKLMWRAFGASCPYCRALNGKIVGIQESFLDEGDFKPEGVDEPLRSFGSVGHAPIHSGCLTGDSHISPGSRITAVTKRWFDGDVVTVHVASGHKLTCTPNHPILTPSGWLAAGLLEKGGHVIGDLRSERGSHRDRNHENVPSRIQDVVDSFRRQAEMVTVPVPVSAEDFHGDGKGSDVAVIWTNRLLMDGGNAPCDEHRREFALVTGNTESSRLPRLSGQALLSEGFEPSGGGDMSRSGLSLPFVGAHLGSSDKSRSAAIPGSNAVLDESLANSPARYPEFERQGIFGLPAHVKADQVVLVDRQPFHGFVYNLETETGWYVAESIVTHNCDCTVVPA